MTSSNSNNKVCVRKFLTGDQFSIIRVRHCRRPLLYTYISGVAQKLGPRCPSSRPVGGDLFEPERVAFLKNRLYYTAKVFLMICPVHELFPANSEPWRACRGAVTLAARIFPVVGGTTTNTTSFLRERGSAQTPRIHLTLRPEPEALKIYISRHRWPEWLPLRRVLSDGLLSPSEQGWW